MVVVVVAIIYIGFITGQALCTNTSHVSPAFPHTNLTRHQSFCTHNVIGCHSHQLQTWRQHSQDLISPTQSPPVSKHAWCPQPSPATLITQHLMLGHTLGLYFLGQKKGCLFSAQDLTGRHIHILGSHRDTLIACIFCSETTYCTNIAWLEDI